jgi:uncharacterized damage-inducible protein DinB
LSSELDRIGQQLRTTFEGGAWHGPSVLEALAGVTAEQAHGHPIAGAHSIWELVLHLQATHRLVLRRLRGDAAPLAPDEDWPAVPRPTAADWDAAVSGLRQSHEELRGAVAAYGPDRLDDPIVAEPPYPAYVQFIGVTQHDLYHAGQIALLKRALAAGRGGERP